MKYLVLAASLLSVSAWACPDLAGTYTCRNDQGAYDMTITQNGNHYHVTSPEGVEDYIADGQTRTIPDQNEFRNGKLTVSCAGSEVQAHQTGDFWENGQQAGSIDMNMYFSKGGSQELITRISGMMIYQGQQYPMDGTSSCARK